MSWQAWFRPPRHLLLLFLVLTLVPSTILMAFGWRILRQDRALAIQQVQERREQAADLIVAALEQSLSAVEESLRDPSAIPSLARAEDAVTLVFRPGRVEAFPTDRLLYYPVAPERAEAPAQPFAAAENLEFRVGDHAGAAKALRDMARSADPAVRAGAFMRLARNLRNSGQADAALDAYAQAAEIRGAAVSGLAADLAAGWARCDLLAQANRNAELRAEAGGLLLGLSRGRWPIDRATFEFHMQEVRRWLGDSAGAAPPDALALAAAAEWLWNQWTRMPTRGRERVVLGGVPVTILWDSNPDRFAALAAGPTYVERQWIGKLAPLLERQHVRIALRDRNPHAVLAESRRTPGDTGLPWPVAVASTDLESELARISSRRSLWLAGFAILAALVIAGTWVIARAVGRELAVARLQTDFVAAVSHEFRTPLTSLRQLTEILTDGRIASESRRVTYYQALARQTERLHRLVESLLDFGRMEAGTSPYRLEPLDACAFIRSVVQEFETEAAGRGYRVELDIDGPSATIAADREALTNALWNLLDNAVKYSPESRTVWVNVERRERRLAIQVRDLGMGIPRAEQREIFRKFVRGAAAKAENIKGTGIGLAMVDHIVTAHGGAVSVASEAGRGQHVHGSAAAAAGDGGIMSRILIVEDEPDIALGLEDDLTVEGHQVEVIADGETAARRGRDPAWDLILLDVMLPRKDGFDVCRDLRRSGVHTPIILLTAKAQEAEKILGLELGADDYVTKPFSPRELRARIRAVLRRVAPPHQDTYRFGDVEVDFARAEVRRNEQAVEVTPIEFKLLAAFVERRGRVLSRDQLLEAAWDRDVHVTDRAVEAHIVNLRRKVEPRPAEPQYLLSVRGLGYRFDG